MGHAEPNRELGISAYEVEELGRRVFAGGAHGISVFRRERCRPDYWQRRFTAVSVFLLPESASGAQVHIVRAALGAARGAQQHHESSEPDSCADHPVAAAAVLRDRW